MTNPEVIGIDLGGKAIKLGRFLRWYLYPILNCTYTPTIYPEAVLDTWYTRSGKSPRGERYSRYWSRHTRPSRCSRLELLKLRLIWMVGWIFRFAGLVTFKNWCSGGGWYDANCAALGEAWLGAGRHYRNSILLTLGTGVGGAIIIDGKLFTGAYGSAGELGLISFNPDGPPCNSGNNGSLEQYLSIPAIRRLTGKEPKEMGDLAAAGDTDA